MHNKVKVYFILFVRLLGSKAINWFKIKIDLCFLNINLYLHSPKQSKCFVLWRHSSAGSEHLPYKQRVTGSNPVASTKKASINFEAFFYLNTFRIIY